MLRSRADPCPPVANPRRNLGEMWRKMGEWESSAGLGPLIPVAAGIGTQLAGH